MLERTGLHFKNNAFKVKVNLKLNLICSVTKTRISTQSSQKSSLIKEDFLNRELNLNFLQKFINLIICFVNFSLKTSSTYQPQSHLNYQLPAISTPNPNISPSISRLIILNEPHRRLRRLHTIYVMLLCS